MPRFVALLGGINVGGHRVTMDRLRDEVGALGHTDVATFIASGNVLFSAPGRTTAAAHEAQLEAHLGERLGWPVPTFVRTADRVIEAAALQPFGEVPEGHTHMVVFCRTAPDPAVLGTGTALDRFHVSGHEVHWHIAGKLTDSAITLPKLAKLLGPNTTRNATTVRKLAALLQA